MERGGPGRLGDQWRGESSPNPRAQPPTPSEGAGGRASGRGEGQDQQRPRTSGAQQSPTRKVLPPASRASRATLETRLPTHGPREPCANPSLAYLLPPASPEHLRHLTLTAWNPLGGLAAPTRMHKCRSHFRPSGRPGGCNPPPWRVPVGRAILYGCL